MYQHRGHAIFHRTEGEGPALLLVHGFPSASWDWHPMWPELTARFRAIAGDRIGYGWSDKRAFASGLTAIFRPKTPPSAELTDELWTLLRHHDGHLVLHLLIGYMAERRKHRDRWAETIIRTKVPLRLIDGPEDPVSGAHLVARFRELVPGGDAVELPGLGHYPQIEDPAGVLRAFLAFHERLGT